MTSSFLVPSFRIIENSRSSSNPAFSRAHVPNVDCMKNITFTKNWPSSPLKNQNPEYISMRFDGKKLRWATEDLTWPSSG